MIDWHGRGEADLVPYLFFEPTPNGVDMNTEFIITAVVALCITVKVFAGVKVLPAIIGYMGVFALLTMLTNYLFK